MKRTLAIISAVLLSTSITVSAADRRHYLSGESSSTHTIEFTLADVYYNQENCLALGRISGSESINGNVSSFGQDNKITAYNFYNGQRWILDLKTGSLTDDNDLRDAGLITDNKISYATESTDIVYLNQQLNMKNVIVKTWNYYDLKNRHRSGKSLNYGEVVNCSQMIAEMQELANNFTGE